MNYLVAEYLILRLTYFAAGHTTLHLLSQILTYFEIMGKLAKYSTFEKLKAANEMVKKSTKENNKVLSEFEQLFSLLKNNSALQKSTEASRGE